MENKKYKSYTYILVVSNVLTMQSSAASYAQAVGIFRSTVLPRVERPCGRSKQHGEENESFEHICNDRWIVGWFYSISINNVLTLGSYYIAQNTTYALLGGCGGQIQLEVPKPR